MTRSYVIWRPPSSELLPFRATTCRCFRPTRLMQKSSHPNCFGHIFRLGQAFVVGPALDREFKTIDFLTLLDLESMSSCARSRFSLLKMRPTRFNQQAG